MAALVVNSDYETGGTWAGALEQLEKLRYVPIFVRANGDVGKGLQALRERGALAWPDPKTAEQLDSVLNAQMQPDDSWPKQATLSLFEGDERIEREG